MVCMAMGLFGVWVVYSEQRHTAPHRTNRDEMRWHWALAAQKKRIALVKCLDNIIEREVGYTPPAVVYKTLWSLKMYAVITVNLKSNCNVYCTMEVSHTQTHIHSVCSEWLNVSLEPDHLFALDVVDFAVFGGGGRGKNVLFFIQWQNRSTIKVLHFKWILIHITYKYSLIFKSIWICHFPWNSTINGELFLCVCAVILINKSP